MFIIAQEDLIKFQETVDEVLSQIAGGKQRVDEYVQLGDDFNPVIVTGYWVKDIIRIDIKVKK